MDKIRQQFQYPEGFWPDSDLTTEWVKWLCREDEEFQYPEGFWPDSDYIGWYHHTETLNTDEKFQYPEGFWPDSDRMPAPCSAGCRRSRQVSVPRRVLAR